MQEPKMNYRLIPGRAGRGRGGLKPALIICHIQEGKGPLSRFFGTVEADSTAWISEVGIIERYLYDTDTAWTNGFWAEPVNHADPAIEAVYRQGIESNRVSLTIEHEGYPGQPRPAAQMEASAQLIAYWCVTWGIPCDRNHIVGHYEVGEHKQCPGKLFPFDSLIARAQAIIAAGGSSSPAQQSQPQGDSRKMKSVDGSDIWIVYPISTAYKQWGWLGLPLNSMSSLAERGYPGDGCTQDFERGRVEIRKDEGGNYRDPELGVVNSELFKLQGKL